MNYGTRLKFETNLGLSFGSIHRIVKEEKNTYYYGFLEKGEGEFELIDTPSHYAGSIRWSEKVCRKYSFNASYINKFEVQQ